MIRIMKNSDETCVIDDIYIVVTTGNLYTYVD
jgi:hypothetical protein